MMRNVFTFMVLTVACLPSLASAAASDVSQALRERAETLCRDDALRLCANALPDEAAVIACMRPKRASLTASCRTVFDEVNREVRR